MVAKQTMMPAPREYPGELRDRAVRLVREDGEHGAFARIADRLDVNRETLRNWVKRRPSPHRGANGTASPRKLLTWSLLCDVLPGHAVGLEDEVGSVGGRRRSMSRRCVTRGSPTSTSTWRCHGSR
jgi:hypothetical protein